MRSLIRFTVTVLLVLAIFDQCSAQSVSQTINLKNGFNFISFTVKPDSTPQQLIERDPSVAEIYLYSAASAFSKYSTLSVGNMLPGENASDAYRFYSEGYASVLVTERLKDDGWPLNPYYHKDSDFYLDQTGTPQKYNGSDYIDIDYATQIVKGVVGWAASAAVPVN